MATSLSARRPPSTLRYIFIRYALPKIPEIKWVFWAFAMRWGSLFYPVATRRAVAWMRWLRTAASVRTLIHSAVAWWLRVIVEHWCSVYMYGAWRWAWVGFWLFPIIIFGTISISVSTWCPPLFNHVCRFLWMWLWSCLSVRTSTAWSWLRRIIRGGFFWSWIPGFSGSFSLAVIIARIPWRPNFSHLLTSMRFAPVFFLVLGLRVMIRGAGITSGFSTGSGRRLMLWRTTFWVVMMTRVCGRVLPLRPWLLVVPMVCRRFPWFRSRDIKFRIPPWCTVVVARLLVAGVSVSMRPRISLCFSRFWVIMNILLLLPF